MNPLLDLKKYRHSIWLDYLRPALIIGGELERLIREDGLRGLTSHPAIFEKVIAGSPDYDEVMAEFIDGNPHLDSLALYEELAARDIQMAADLLRKIDLETDGEDGYISLGISPALAHDTRRTIEEAMRLWKKINRPNVMIKVPATPEGLLAIEALIADGIHVNATSIFSLAHYEAVSEAYLRGLTRCAEPRKVTSVVSFSVGRVDTAVDEALEAKGTQEALALRGKIAVANAKIIYRRFREISSGEKWTRLAERGGRVQRPCWTNTGTKKPSHSDVLYVEELIGPDTVNALPPVTFFAFKDHGKARAGLEEKAGEAENDLRSLAKLDLNLEALAARLQEEEVASSAESFRSVLVALEEKRRALPAGRRIGQSFSLGKYQASFEKRLASWKKMNYSRRFWSKDITLWADRPTAEIKNRMGWLDLPELMPDWLGRLTSFAAGVKAEGFSHAVLLGMGGSSLAPELFQKTFGNSPGYPELLVLDSTHPAAVLAVEKKIDSACTLFLVSSKSGTTVETLSFFRYFWNKISRLTDAPGRRFIAITDPGTPLALLARERKFRALFEAHPEVGGRYSALTDFGLVPAALIGMDVRTLVDRTRVAAENNAFCVSEDAASGYLLGAALAEAAKHRNKLTILASASLSRFPDWLEQLIAESTGKDGQGIVPIVDEPWIPLAGYGQDRFFVGLDLEKDRDRKLESRLNTLQNRGQPVIRINLKDLYALGQEIFRWEIAVASAGSALGIQPFNQPDVELAKELAQNVMKQEKGTDLKTEDAAETISVHDAGRLKAALKNWISSARPGDYIAIQAYLHQDRENSAALQNLRLELLKRTKLATTLGYGPRFLHSTGQLHKGGPEEGLFLQIVDEPAEDLPIPETDSSFGALIKAQSLGDYLALRQKKRRVLRTSLKDDIPAGLDRMRRALKGL